MLVSRPVLAGLAYFALIFALGFVVGAVREGAFRVGEDEARRLAAVWIEGPVMLAASWFVSAWLVRRLAVPASAGARLGMGAVALALLLCAEAFVGVGLMGRTPEAHIALYARPSYGLGLLLQLGFAAIPLMQSGLLRR